MGLRIGFVSGFFLPNLGGTEIPMYLYARELVCRDHEVIVYTSNIYRGRPARLKMEEVMEGVTVKRFSVILTLFYRTLLVAPLLVKALIKDYLDILHIFSLYPSFFILIPILISKMRKIPLVMYPQSFPNRSITRREFSLLRYIGLFFDNAIAPRILRYAGHVFTLTKAEAHFYAERGIRHVTLIREPINTPINPDQSSLKLFRDKVGLRNDGPVLLFVGRVTKQKGVDVLIEAFSIVVKEFPAARLLLVGEDWGELPKWRRLAEKLGCITNIVFVGPLGSDELSYAYSLADIFVLPSYFEGLPRTVIEAWAHKSPVVATRVGGLVEIVNEDRGLLVEPGDAKSLAEAILSLLRKPALKSRMGLNGYSFVINEFEPKSNVDKLERAYLALARDNVRLV